MKAGELVKKYTGHEEGKVGIVLKIITNDVGNTIVTVLSDGEVRHWYAKYVGAWDDKKGKDQR